MPIKLTGQKFPGEKSDPRFPERFYDWIEWTDLMVDQTQHYMRLWDLRSGQSLVMNQDPTNITGLSFPNKNVD